MTRSLIESVHILLSRVIGNRTLAKEGFMNGLFWLIDVFGNKSTNH